MEGVPGHLRHELTEHLLALDLVEGEDIRGSEVHEEVHDPIHAAVGVAEVLDVPRREAERLGHRSIPALPRVACLRRDGASGRRLGVACNRGVGYCGKATQLLTVGPSWTRSPVVRDLGHPSNVEAPGPSVPGAVPRHGTPDHPGVAACLSPGNGLVAACA